MGAAICFFPSVDTSWRAAPPVPLLVPGSEGAAGQARGAAGEGSVFARGVAGAAQEVGAITSSLSGPCRGAQEHY